MPGLYASSVTGLRCNGGSNGSLQWLAIRAVRRFEKAGGERGIRTPGTRWVQQISSLPHSTTLPSLRGRAELHILSGADAFFAAHVAAQGGRDDERAVGLLVVLEDSDERAADCEA